MYWQLASFSKWAHGVVPGKGTLADLRALADWCGSVQHDDVTYHGTEITVSVPSAVGRPDTHHWTHLFVWRSNPDTAVLPYTNIYTIDEIRQTGTKHYINCSFAAAWTEQINRGGRSQVTELLTSRYSITDDPRSMTAEPVIDALTTEQYAGAVMTMPTDWSLVYTCAVHPGTGEPIGTRPGDRIPTALKPNGVISPPYTLKHYYTGTKTGTEKIADLIADFGGIVADCGPAANRILRAQIVPTAWINAGGDSLMEQFQLFTGTERPGTTDIVTVVKSLVPNDPHYDQTNVITNHAAITSPGGDEKAYYYDAVTIVKVNGSEVAKIPRSTYPNAGLTIKAGYTVVNGLNFYCVCNDQNATRFALPMPEIVAYGDFYSEYVKQNQGVLTANGATATISVLGGLVAGVAGLATGNVAIGAAGIASAVTSGASYMAQQNKQMHNALTSGSLASSGSALSNADECTALLSLSSYRHQFEPARNYLRRYGYASTRWYDIMPQMPVNGRRNYTYVEGDLREFRWEYDSTVTLLDMTVTEREMYESLRDEIAHGVLYWHPVIEAAWLVPGYVQGCNNPY